MFTDEIMGHMLSNAYKKSEMIDENFTVKADISEEEALEIYNEIVDIFKNHNVSYQCACRLTIALNNAFLSGAAELYERENYTNP